MVRQVCKKLRVMNAVRRFDVGIPMTFMQYEVLTAEQLLERLQQRFVLHGSLLVVLSSALVDVLSALICRFVACDAVACTTSQPRFVTT